MTRPATARTPEIQIAGRTVGPGFPMLIVAEVAQAHDGSLGAAHAYIDAAARAGVDAIKFQTHIASAESTPRDRFRVDVFPQDASRYDYWKRMEFTPEQWAGLAGHAAQAGLTFLSTPFSIEAVELLDRLDVPAWKIGSGDIGHLPLLETVARTGRPVLLSSGMSPWQELDEAVDWVRRHGSSVAVFQCTTAYPCPPEHVGLNVLDELRERYGCPVGLSDHSATIFGSLAAATLGANLAEVHLVLSRDSFGPDTNASITPAELASLVDGVRFIERALAHPVDKDAEAARHAENRALFGRSLVAARDLPAGHRLEPADVACKKPGGGMPPGQLPTVIGSRLARAYAQDESLEETDLER